MAERRPLTEGLKPSTADSSKEKEFVYAGKAPASSEAPAVTAPPSVQTPKSTQSRIPISTRMRTDFATALKRASLERQLNGMEPSALQDILEQAVEPWLRSNGYLT
jgi:hypothetical protein